MGSTGEQNGISNEVGQGGIRWPRLDATRGVLTAVGAHDGLTARLVEEAGFDAVWASGLEISASLGLPDADVVGASETARAVETIRRSTSLPVIVDCDAGYGNAMNAYHLARGYFSSGVFGLCLEDKSFPKLNSFAAGDHDLIPIPTMVGKLQAMADQKVDQEQVVIARTETLIAGRTVAEALDRSHAYAEGGADAILIHDKSRHAEDLVEFAKQWDSPTPLICVPTTYFDWSRDQLGELGFALVIYANQGIRSQVAAVRSVLARIQDEGGTAGVEEKIASVADVFGLQRLSEFNDLFSRFVR